MRPTYGSTASFVHAPPQTICQPAIRAAIKAEMSSVAEELRGAREAQGFSVHQMAELTKMRSDHIRALEEGNYDVFVAPVYVRGFVRTYSTLLKLDTGKVMETLESELKQSKKHRDAPPLTDEPRGVLDWVSYQLSRVDWRLWLPIVSVLVVAGLAIWIYRAVKTHQAEDPLRDLKPGVYQPARPTGADTLPVPAPAPARR
jgi:cytoskeletal protein RodZ